MSFATVLARLQKLENPYPGLRPFETQESHLFFGRDQQVAELVGRLERNRFLAILGVSGSGKSSLVRAGLIPALERGRASEVGKRWRIVVARPSGTPFESLGAELVKAGFDASRLKRSSHGLIEVAQQLPKEESLLIVVDQFEELFRYKDRELVTEEARRKHDALAADAAEFVQLLLAGCGHQPPVYIVVTMRSDYLGDCAEFRDLPETLNDGQYLVPRMTRDQRKEAIEGPLGRVEIVPSLVQRMLNDAGDEPDQLPILQHALMRTWNHWRRVDPSQKRRIELQDYESIGGFEGALNQHADELLAGVPKDIAAAIFKRLAARGGSNRERRDPAPQSELWAVCAAQTQEGRATVTTVIDHFRQGDATFLAPRDGALGPDTYIDITHESLIRRWKTLREDWLPEEQKSAKTLFDLVERAKNWKDRGGATLTGLDLTDAEEWDKQRNQTTAWAKHYVDETAFGTVLKFIEASRTEERKRRRRGRRSLWIAACAALLFAALAAVALYQWNQARLAKQLAQRQRSIAEHDQLVRELVQSSADSLADDPERSLLLAMHAVRANSPVNSELNLLLENAVHGAVEAFRNRVTLSGHQGAVRRAVYSPDGTKIASAGDDGTLRVWDAASGKQLYAIIAHTGGALVVAWRRDGQRLASGGADGLGRVWDAVSGEKLAELKGHRGAVTGIAWSPDGNLATSSDDNSSMLWTGSGQHVRTLQFNSVPVHGIAWNKDGTMLVSAEGSDAVVWDIRRSEPVRHLREPFQGDRYGVAWSPDGKYIATASHNRTVEKWDANTGKLLETLNDHIWSVQAVAWSPDGKWLAAVSGGQVKVWPEEIRVIGEDPKPSGFNQPGATSVDWSPDGKRLAIASEDGKVRLSNVVPEEALNIPISTQTEPTAMAWSPGGKHIAAATEDETLVFDPQSGREVARLPGARQIAWSPEGNRLAHGLMNGRVAIWNPESRKEERNLDIEGAIYSLTWSPDGRHLAAVVAKTGDDRRLDVWDIEHGWDHRQYRGNGYLSVVAWSPDSQSLVIVSNYSTFPSGTIGDMFFWKPSSFFPGHIFKRLSLWIFTPAWSPDGTRLAVSSPDGLARLLAVPSGEVVLSLSGHTAGVSDVEWEPGGRRIATASDDRTVRVWSSSGQSLLTLSGARDRVSNVSWSPDGKRLAAASADGVIRVFAMELQGLMEVARRQVKRNLTLEECRKYLHQQSCPPIP